MGKSGHRKKKSSSPHPFPAVSLDNAPPTPIPSSDPPPPPSPPIKIEHFAAVFLRRAHELKEEGNRKFQAKDYRGAMEKYEQAIHLTPRNVPDRAVFHSNKAACLMQMKPVQYETVVKECSLALEAHPGFGRALFRRARAFEALGKLDLALRDIQLLLQADPNSTDALELARRIRLAIRNRDEERQAALRLSKPVLPPASSTSPYAGTSPAALGASVVNGTKGPPKAVSKKRVGKLDQPSIKPTISSSSVARQSGMQTSDIKNTVSSPSTAATSEFVAKSDGDVYLPKTVTTDTRITQETRESTVTEPAAEKPAQKVSKIKDGRNSLIRPLKLIYDHDIRRAQMPAGCSFKELREIVRRRFPSSKAVLIKYKDAVEDLVTITNTEEIRLAEATVSPKAVVPEDSSAANSSNSQNALKPLRLYVVEVTADQEPDIEEEVESVNEVTDDERYIDSGAKGNKEGAVDERYIESGAEGNNEDALDAADKQESKLRHLEGNIHKDGNVNKDKEQEIDDWLVDFANLFRTHIGVDPDAHVDLHEFGMELCTEALEETVTSEDAQPLFEAAACKFQEVAALAFFNWGNVHMCAARKRVPREEMNEAELYQRLKVAYDWACGQYQQARKKYEEALRVKPDFYEGVLALGQESFECAKLQWSLAVASRVDLTTWDSTEILRLFKNAEERMEVAISMWEKLKEERLKQTAGAFPEKKASESRALKIPSEAETQEQFMVMGLQINLFWGNILFEHSQVEYKLGLGSWKSLLDEAVKKFELAGASTADIAVVLKNHVSNFTCSCEMRKPTRDSVKHKLCQNEDVITQEDDKPAPKPCMQSAD